MKIIGVLVHARVADAPSVRTALEALVGVEVHGGVEQGRLVVTIEGDDDAGIALAQERVSRTDGVLSVALVYHHDEPVEG